MDSEKAIFEYVDGAGVSHKGDPVELLRRLEICCKGTPNQLMRRASYPTLEDPAEDAPPDTPPTLKVPEGFEENTCLDANQQLGRAVCKAFQLGPLWDDLKGVGVMEGVWGKVLDDFLLLLKKKEQKDDSPPTSPASTAPPS